METQSGQKSKYEVLPLTLWSQLQRRLASCGLTKGAPEQWIGTINNLQSSGVSAIEIEWCRVEKLLGSSSARSVTLGELLKFLTANSPCELVLQRQVTDQYAPFVCYEKQQRPTDLSATKVRNGRRELRLLHYQDRIFGLCIWLHVEMDAGLFGRHRYWSFSVPRGGKKIAKIPINKRFINPQQAMAYGRILIERMVRRLAADGFVGQPRSLNQFEYYVLPGGEEYTEWLITAPNISVEYLGPHFDLPNIIAHVRTTERVSREGKRFLLLEEIQSDWNQQLREVMRESRSRGLPGDAEEDMIDWDELDAPPRNPYLNHWLDAALRMMLILAAKRELSGIAWLPGSVHAERFPWANKDGLEAFYDFIVPGAVEKLGRSWGAALNEYSFSTLSRKFKLRWVAKGSKWEVISVQTGQLIGDSFSDRQEAEAFRRSIESQVWESVSSLTLVDEIRKDVVEYGLPRLGAIGNRMANAGTQPRS